MVEVAEGQGLAYTDRIFSPSLTSGKASRLPSCSHFPTTEDMARPFQCIETSTAAFLIPRWFSGNCCPPASEFRQGVSGGACICKMPMQKTFPEWQSRRKSQLPLSWPAGTAAAKLGLTTPTNDWAEPMAAVGSDLAFVRWAFPGRRAGLGWTMRDFPEGRSQSLAAAELNLPPEAAADAKLFCDLLCRSNSELWSELQWTPRPPTMTQQERTSSCDDDELSFCSSIVLSCVLSTCKIHLWLLFHKILTELEGERRLQKEPSLICKIYMTSPLSRLCIPFLFYFTQL